MKPIDKHTPADKWTLNTMTGVVFRHGEMSGTNIISGYGIAHELIGDANMIPTLLSQRNELREALTEMVAIADMLASAGQHLFPIETAVRARAALATTGEGM